MTMFQVSRLLTTYVVIKAAVYVVCWVVVFFLLMTIGSVSPKTALWITQLAEPFSALLRDMFWAFVPEPGQVVRTGARFFGWLGRKALTHTNEKTQLIVQLGLLNGIVVVSFFGWLAHFAVMRRIKKWLLRKYFPAG